MKPGQARLTADMSIPAAKPGRPLRLGAALPQGGGELGVERAKRNGREVVELMKKRPTDDSSPGQGTIRADGRKVNILLSSR